MNKTVNINLANIFFHIDEEAYNKLRRYLEAIKRSFAGTKGSEEIIADIEMRIAELFHEKMENDRQVITQKEVDEVITIMGQPEDYMVDEDIFEDEPKSTPKPNKSKKFYRDIDAKYIGGVSAGLGHYLGIEPVWIRLLWILLTIFSWGGFIFIYILLWILIPEASTTSQKLDMRGEDINISNIERKVKEGFDDVAEKVKNADYQKMGNKVKSSSKTFFDSIGDLIMFLFKIAGKFIGILLIIIGASTLIGLFIALFTVGIWGAIHFPGIDFYDIVNSTDAPVWFVSLLGFFAIAIPFFFLMYLGLKILVNNLKSIGNIAKFSLLGLWLLSIAGLIVLGLKQATAHAYTGSVSTKEMLHFNRNIDTLTVKMGVSELYENQEDFGFNGMTISYDTNGNKVLFSDDVTFNFKKSEDSLMHLKIRKDADGSSYKEARERAGKINYHYSLEGQHIILDNFFTTDVQNKIRNQEVNGILYIPENTIVKFDESSKNHIGGSTKNDQDLYRYGIPDHVWKMGNDGTLKCLDCTDNEDNEGEDHKNGHVIINENGVDINLHDKESKESLKVKIDKNGVQVKTNENK